MPSPITTHVLDLALGCPASGIIVRLDRLDDDTALTLATAETDDDGRVRDLLPPNGQLSFTAGTYRLQFETKAYFAATGRESFYPTVTITFTVSDPSQHYHVPLLLSPFGYSTYRGS